MRFMYKHQNLPFFNARREKYYSSNDMWKVIDIISENRNTKLCNIMQMESWGEYIYVPLASIPKSNFIIKSC